jgi:hypothetical protein
MLITPVPSPVAVAMVCEYCRHGRGGQMTRVAAVLSAVIVGAAMLAACGSSTPSTTTSTTSSTSTTTSTTVAGAENLGITPAVRASLLAAGAAWHSLPVSDYTGLQAGTAYYAYDPATSTYYAAAGLDASASSEPAQVGDQDDGAYLLFTEPSGSSTWTVYGDGLGGAQGSTCPITLPAVILELWSWLPHTCYPPV